MRRALLDGAAAIAASQGLAAISVQTVADAAKVTKGGLFHHFPSKDALLDGVLADQLGKLDTTIDAMIAADPMPRGRFTRAYVALIFDQWVPGARSTWAAMSGMAAASPQIRTRWAEWLAARLRRHADTDSGLDLELVRLAADGAWQRYLVDRRSVPFLPQVQARLIGATKERSG